MNDTFDLEELFLRNINSSPIYDRLYVFLIIPISSFGVLSNFISFFIFLKKNFRTEVFFKYCQVYTLNSFRLFSPLD